MNGLRQALHRLRQVSFCKAVGDAGVDAAGVTYFVAKIGCLVHVANTYLATVVIMYGPSMLPTFNISGDVALMERISPRLGRIGVGDIVLARSPEFPRKLIVKRVVGMEGDRVSFPVLERGGGMKHLVVPKAHVWLQGDNPYDSNDSRQFGAIPYGLVEGKAFFRIWPPDRFGSILPSTSQ